MFPEWQDAVPVQHGVNYTTEIVMFFIFTIISMSYIQHSR